MAKALLFFLACMALLRLQFALFADVVILDPVFLAGFYAAFAVPAPASLWMALFIGLAGDWMVGYPMGLQGLGLVVVAYLAFRVKKHVLMTSFFHFLLLTLGLILLQALLMYGLNLSLHLRFLMHPRSRDALTVVGTALVGAILAHRHEKRNRL